MIPNSIILSNLLTIYSQQNIGNTSVEERDQCKATKKRREKKRIVKFEPLLRIRIFKILQNNLSSTSEGWIQFKNFELNKNLCNKADEKEVLDIDDSGTKLELRGEPKMT